MLWLLIGYLFLFIHRPFEVWPILSTIRIEMLYMVVTGSVWLAAPDKRFQAHPLHVALLAFAGAVLICTLTSPWCEQALEAMDAYFKFLIYYLMLVTIVQDEEGLRKLMLGFLGVMGLYMLHSLWEFHCGRHVFRMGIPRMIGVDLSSNDPNSFAASILLALVFVPALWRSQPSQRLRWCLASFVGLALLCIALTGSRGAFVGLIIWGTVTVWSSPWRKRLLVLALPAAPLLFLCLPENLQNRFHTIIDSDVGPANAKQSSEARVEGFLIGMQLWADNPATGIGPCTWLTATGRQLRAHNLYGQLAGEMGTLGVLTFGGLVTTFFTTLVRLRRDYRRQRESKRDFLYHMSGATGLGVFILLFEGNFGHNLFRYNWALFVGFLSITAVCMQRRPTELPDSRDYRAGAVDYADADLAPAYTNSM